MLQSWQMFEGGPGQKFQLPRDIAISRATNMQRPAFTVSSYPSGLKE